MLTYEITQKADNDIFSSLAYIKNELCNVDAARNLYAEIFKTIEDLTIFPRSTYDYFTLKACVSSCNG